MNFWCLEVVERLEDDEISSGLLSIPLGLRVFGGCEGAGAEVPCAISSMSGLASKCSGLPTKKEGMRTVRGTSFPFELIFGVPI